MGIFLIYKAEMMVNVISELNIQWFLIESISEVAQVSGRAEPALPTSILECSISGKESIGFIKIPSYANQFNFAMQIINEHEKEFLGRKSIFQHHKLFKMFC